MADAIVRKVEGRRPVVVPAGAETLNRYVEATAAIRDETQAARDNAVAELGGLGFPAASARPGKYLAWDANGAAVASVGTGADAGLRADLSAAAGASLVSYGSQTVADAIASKLDNAGTPNTILGFDGSGNAVERGDIATTAEVAVVSRDVVAAQLRRLNDTRKVAPEAESVMGLTLDVPTVTSSAGGETLGSGSALVPDTNPNSSITWASIGGVHTATVTTAASHRLITGERIVIAGATDAAFNGTKTITVTGSQTFTFTFSSSAFPPTPDATGSSSTWRRIVASVSAIDPVFTYPAVPREALTSTRSQTWQGASVTLNPPEIVSNVPYIGFPVEFISTGHDFEIMTGQSGISRLFVDGVPTNGSGYTATSNPSYPGQVLRFLWGSAKPRLIRAELPYYSTLSRFYGVNLKARGELLPAPRSGRPRMVAFFDSFGEGTGAFNSRQSCLAFLSQMMGWELINMAVGDTGIVANGDTIGKANYIDRLEQDLKPYQPDIVFVGASVNDGGSLTTTNVGALLDRIAATAPNAQIIGFGPLWPTESVPAASLTSATAMKAACDARAIPYVDGGIGLNGDPQWITAANKNVYYAGSAATATATIAANAVTAVNVTGAGTGYDPHHGAPAVSFSGGGGTGATATAVMNYTVGDIQVLQKGSGYTSAPTVTLTNGGTAIAVRTGSAITALILRNPGWNYTVAPTVTISGGGGTGATGTATIENGKVVGLTLTAGGAGYTSTPTVTLTTSTSDATATATINANGEVTGVTITDAGTGYTSAPNIVFSGGGGSGAVAVAHLRGTVASVNVTAGGSAYTSAPTVTIAHPHPEGSSDTTHPKTNGHQLIAERIAAQLRKLAA